MKQPTNDIYIAIPRLLLSVACCFLLYCSEAQTDSTKRKVLQFNGTITVTNNGFSYIPFFSLGKPAVLTNFYISGGKRFSFEPEFRYSLKFRPWSIIFIWRYKIVDKEKYKFIVGTHLPTLSFVTTKVIKNGVEKEITQARRFFPVLDAFSNHIISKNVSLGLFYQYGRGLETDVPRNGHYLSLRTNFSNIQVGELFNLRLNPQFYILKLDKEQGWFVATGIYLSRNHLPLSLSSTINKAIHSDISGKKFDWNLSLIYSFSNTYKK